MSEHQAVAKTSEVPVEGDMGDLSGCAKYLENQADEWDASADFLEGRGCMQKMDCDQRRFKAMTIRGWAKKIRAL